MQRKKDVFRACYNHRIFRDECFASFFFDTRLDKTSGIHKRFGNNALVFIQQWKLSEATVSPVCNFATHQQTVKLV